MHLRPMGIDVGVVQQELFIVLFYGPSYGTVFVARGQNSKN
jgi:hypothetical protein